ncbi:MAG: DUF2267 domain-containing protein [Thermoanaerobaculia bacterium]|nr:DUF2267 domain-containing protein [Thermoanaerobaculia bacterium]
MTMTTVSSLNRSLEKAQIWLKDLQKIGHLRDESQAYSVLRAVLHVLRDRVTPDEGADLGAQLPLVIRGLYYENWKPSRAPASYDELDEFYGRIRGELRGGTDVDPAHAFRSVARLLDQKITAGEMDQIREMMPEAIREIWPERENETA